MNSVMPIQQPLPSKQGFVRRVFLTLVDPKNLKSLNWKVTLHNLQRR
jgi:hypothetical protein